MEGKTNKAIFSEIYAKNVWGGGNEPFFSGRGSHNENIIIPYINTLLQIISNNNIRLITDLGCGDFWIMRHVLSTLDKNNYNFFYNGVDVVEELIDHNNKTFGRANVKFHCMDAAQDNELPFGELLIIRQVLQHLGNADVKKILSKTSAFKFIFVTESIYGGEDAVYNIDINASNGTRCSFKSGVYLERPPYSYKNIVHLMKVPGPNVAGVVIRSSLIINDV